MHFYYLTVASNIYGYKTRVVLLKYKYLQAARAQITMEQSNSSQRVALSQFLDGFVFSCSIQLQSKY